MKNKISVYYLWLFLGANKTAASHIGINVRRMKIFAFIFSAFFAAFAGIIQGSMLGSITPGMGTGNLLLAISTAMLGSTFIKPGIPNIPGTALGAVLLAVISNGLTMIGMIGASFYMKDIIQGIIAIVREEPLTGANPFHQRSHKVNIGLTFLFLHKPGHYFVLARY